MRSLIAQRYLKGSGIEIGAFNSPTLVPRGAKVCYVDFQPASAHRQVPEYRDLWLVEPDIIDDGTTLAKIEDQSVDFVVAAHVLEHIDDPIAALMNWLRVLRPGGRLMIAVPDMRFTDEHERALTSVEHFARDHAHGPAVSADEHFHEIAKVWKKLPADDADAFIAKAEAHQHWHTFTLESLLALLDHVRQIQAIGFRLLHAVVNNSEDLVVLEVE